MKRSVYLITERRKLYRNRAGYEKELRLENVIVSLWTILTRSPVEGGRVTRVMRSFAYEPERCSVSPGVEKQFGFEEIGIVSFATGTVAKSLRLSLGDIGVICLMCRTFRHRNSREDSRGI